MDQQASLIYMQPLVCGVDLGEFETLYKKYSVVKQH